MSHSSTASISSALLSEQANSSVIVQDVLTLPRLKRRYLHAKPNHASGDQYQALAPLLDNVKSWETSWAMQYILKGGRDWKRVEGLLARVDLVESIDRQPE